MGAAIFALEFLHREGMEYYEAILPATWGALVGYFSYIVLTGGNLAPVWEFPQPAALRPVDLLWAAGAGVLSAVVATGFAWTVKSLRVLFLRIPLPARLGVGGAVLGLLSFVSIYALTFGEHQLMEIVESPGVAWFFLLAAAAKFLGSSFTVASGWRGGFIIPLFFIGACLGKFLTVLFPGANEVVLMTALMAGINAGVTKTPLGSSLVVSRMAHLSIIPTTLLSALVAMALTKSVGMIGSQRRRKLLVRSKVQ
jgi:H+/Cl- antiporter ClcA